MGYLKVKSLPLKTSFKNSTPAASLAPNQSKNFKKRPLAPQKPRKGVRLGVCVQ